MRVDTEPGAPRWRRLALTLLLLTQFALPAALLLAPRPARWGWQMYSTTSPAVALTLLGADGAATPLDTGDYLGWNRGEIDAATALPPFVCAQHPGARAVLVRRGDETWEHACRL
jgi:hypothetical protein